MYGLKYIPTLGKAIDNIDIPYKDIRPKPVYSSRDYEKLQEAYQSIRQQCKVILEIGVSEWGYEDHGTTYKLLDEKLTDCFYFGVDIKNKRHLDLGRYNNAFFLKSDSSDLKNIMSFIKDKANTGIIDLLHIDGYHSVNQVVKDWRFAEFVSPHGIIVMHDTNYHYGPTELLKALDPEIFVFEKFFENEIDWGVSVVKRKE